MSTQPRKLRLARAACLALVLPLALSGCFRGGGRLLGAMAWTAVVTAAVVSSQQPPRERVVYVPAPRPGYSWQPGYWTLEDSEWLWVEGRYVQEYAGYRFRPAHWVEDRGGHWRLIPGEWVADGPPGER
jgi:hypothetical protein